MDQRLDAAMSDMDLVPLLIQENYLNFCPSAAGRDENGTARMDAIARTAMSIAEGDIVNVQIRRYRQWQHAQMGAFMSSIIPYVHHIPSPAQNRAIMACVSSCGHEQGVFLVSDFWK